MNYRAVYVVLLGIMTIFTPSGVSAKEKVNISLATPSQEACKYYKEYEEGNFFKDFIQNVFKHRQMDGNSTHEYGWYFKHKGNGLPPAAPPETSYFVSKHECYFLGNPSKKVLYLTFDEGYENGYTPAILDILKKHNAKAAFFVVKPYIDTNPDIIKRMLEEGHLVCNHSSHHPSMPAIKDRDKFQRELTEVEEAYEKVTGKKMPKYFRPPMGKYSESSLELTESLGYKTVFWSFAYEDWEPKKQPSIEFAKKKILDRTHNGAVVLLHAVSKTNAAVLDDIISEWEKQGYELKSLDEFEK